VLAFALILCVAADSTATCTPEELDLRRTAMQAVIINAPDRLPLILEQLKKRNDRCGTSLRRYFLEEVNRRYGEGYAPPRDKNGKALPGVDRMRYARDLAGDPDTTVQAFALNMLNGDTATSSIHVVGQVAKNTKVESIRQIALSVLIRSAARSAGELRAVYPSIKDPQMRLTIVRNVASNDSLAWQWLLDLAGTAKESPEVRAEALTLGLRTSLRDQGTRTALRSKGVATSNALASVYGKLNDASLRLQVVNVLSSRPDDEDAIEQLGKIAKSDTDYGLRQRALQGLQASHSKRALQLLAEISVR